MNKINPLKNQIMLILVLALCCVQLSAQDKITLTWKASANEYKYMLMDITIGKSFKVNWGDGNTENFMSYNEYDYVSCRHAYNTSGEYTVDITANQDCKFIDFVRNLLCENTHGSRRSSEKGSEGVVALCGV